MLSAASRAAGFQFTPPSQLPPYADDLGLDGLIRYKYRGTDPEHSDNRALRTAMARQLPLAYFVGIGKGVYVAQVPAWLVWEDQERGEFAVAVDEGQRLLDRRSSAELSAPQRAYVERLTKLRLHQPVFRARVLRAYAEICAMCGLRHPELLDAAHILPDGHPLGLPGPQRVVSVQDPPCGVRPEHPCRAPRSRARGTRRRAGRDGRTDAAARPAGSAGSTADRAARARRSAGPGPVG